MRGGSQLCGKRELSSGSTRQGPGVVPDAPANRDGAPLGTPAPPSVASMTGATGKSANGPFGAVIGTPKPGPASGMTISPGPPSAGAAGPPSGAQTALEKPQPPCRPPQPLAAPPARPRSYVPAT